MKFVIGQSANFVIEEIAKVSNYKITQLHNYPMIYVP